MKVSISVLSVLICCCFLAHPSLSSDDNMMSMSKRGRVQLCGSELVDTLTLICGGIFHGPNQMVRRDNMAAERAKFYPSWWQMSEGIVDECCKRSCTISVLQSYCGK